MSTATTAATEQKPILRGKVEAWLRGPEGRRAGALRHVVVAKGGALDVTVERPGTRPGGG